MPGVDEVKTQIAASVDEVDRAVVSVRGVIDQIDDALTRLRLITSGSVHPRAADAVLRLEAARERLFEAQMLAIGGIEAAQDYRTSI